MHDASLNRRLRKHGGDRVRKALQAVDDGDQHIFDAAVLQLVHHPQPELGAFILLEPQPQDLLGSIGAHAERDMDRLVADQSFVADLHSQGVEEDQRIGRFQRARLPGRDLLQHRVGHRADQVGGDLDAVEIAQMADDLPGAHAAGVHRNDLVVEPWKAALVLGDQLRVKARLAVARHLQLDLPGIGDDRLPAVPVAPVAGRLAGQMMIHLGVQHSLGQRLLQIIKQAIRVKCGLRVGTSQKLVEDGIGYTRLFASRHGWAPLLPSCPTPHEIPDSSATRWTAAHRGPAFFAYSANYLIDIDNAIIVDVEATTAIRQAEILAAKRMIERSIERFDLCPTRLIGDSAYGSAEMLNWLVHEHGIEPHVPVSDRSKRSDDTFSRDDFAYDHQADVYVCPAGKKLVTTGRRVDDGTTLKYRASKYDCEPCP